MMNADDIEKYKRRHPSSIPVTFEGQQFPSVGQLGQYLATQYEASAATLSYWIRRRGADRQILDNQFRRRGAVKAAVAPRPSSAGRPVVYNGQTFASRSKFLSHMAAELDLPYTTVSMTLYAHDWNLDAAVADMRRHLSVVQEEAHREANGAEPAAAARIPVLEAKPDGLDDAIVIDIPENRPLEFALAEMVGTIGLIRGAYEAREAALVLVSKRLDEARTRLDEARTTIGADPAIGRRLADIENQFARQAASFNAMEKQLAKEASSRAKAHEIVALINRKLTQLVHDLKLEKIPTPTRRDPAAG
jgi:hypothetical protein